MWLKKRARAGSRDAPRSQPSARGVDEGTRPSAQSAGLGREAAAALAEGKQGRGPSAQAGGIHTSRQSPAAHPKKQTGTGGSQNTSAPFAVSVAVSFR